MNVYLGSTELDNVALQSTGLEGIYLGTTEVWNSTPPITITFAKKDSNADWCTFSEASIQVPVGTELLIPTREYPIDSSAPFYLDFYEGSGQGIIKRVTVYNGYSGNDQQSGHLYVPTSVYIDNEYWYRQEGTRVQLNADTTIKIYTYDITYDRGIAKIAFDSSYATFKDRENLIYSGVWKFYGYDDIIWDSSLGVLNEIAVNDNRGIYKHIDSLVGKEGYKIKGLEVRDYKSGISKMVDKNNTHYSLDGHFYSFVPYVIPWVASPYYGFDGNYNNETHLWWLGGMSNNQQFISYASSTIFGMTGINPPSYLSMYGGYNELFYVEGLNESGAVETQKMYCFMQVEIYGNSTSTYAYFLVDVTSLIGTTLTYTPYSKGVTVSSESTLGQYVMTELMNGNGVRGTVNYLNQYYFYESSARNLYQEDQNLYLRKLDFYDQLKENVYSTSGSLILI